MSKEVFIVRQLKDIDALLTASRVRSFSCLAFDPFVYSTALRKGLKNISYMPLNLPKAFHKLIADEAIDLAKRIDSQLSDYRVSILGDGMYSGWEASTFYLFFIRLLTDRGIGNIIQRSLGKNFKINIVSGSTPQFLYLDSDIGGKFYLSPFDGCYGAGFQRRHDAAGTEISYSHSLKVLYNTLFGKVDGRETLIVHVPAANREMGAIVNEVTDWLAIDDQRSAFAIPSPIWDTKILNLPLNSHSSNVAFSDADRRLLRDYRIRAVDVIRNSLLEIVGDSELTRLQSVYSGDLAAQQMAIFLLLRNATSVRKFLVSDQDIGINGPIFSAASINGSDIVIFPHSSSSAAAVGFFCPHNNRVLVRSAEGFNRKLTDMHGAPLNVISIPYSNTIKTRYRASVKVICILLNTMYASGISYVDILTIKSVIDFVSALQDQHGFKFLIRLKPTKLDVEFCSKFFGIPTVHLESVVSAHLQDIAEASDLCLAMGEPTTAINHFLRSGCYVLSCWDAANERIYDAWSDGVLKPLSKDECFEEIRRVIEVPEYLLKQTQKQQDVYRNS